MHDSKALLPIDVEVDKIATKTTFWHEEKAHLPIKETVPFTPFGEKLNKEKWTEYIKLRHEYYECKDLPTACWSYDIEEKEWKWKQYAGDAGVCIISSIHRLMNSLSSSKYKIYCGKINYAKHRHYKDLEKQLFTKDIMYRDDCEMRLYFILNNPLTDIDTSTPFEEEFIRINVNPREMIDFVIMSPFTDMTTRKERRSYLEKMGIRIKAN